VLPTLGILFGANPMNPYRNTADRLQIRALFRQEAIERFGNTPAQHMRWFTICLSHSEDPLEARIDALRICADMEAHLRSNNVRTLAAVEEQPHEIGTGRISYTGHAHMLLRLPSQYIANNNQQQNRLNEKFKADMQLSQYTRQYHKDYRDTKAKYVTTNITKSMEPMPHAIHIARLHSNNLFQEINTLCGYMTKCLTHFKNRTNNRFYKKMPARNRNEYIDALYQVGFICMTDASMLMKYLKLLKSKSKKYLIEHCRDLMADICRGYSKLKYWLRKKKLSYENVDNEALTNLHKVFVKANILKWDTDADKSNENIRTSTNSYKTDNKMYGAYNKNNTYNTMYNGVPAGRSVEAKRRQYLGLLPAG
jgi:hypothetical protein